MSTNVERSATREGNGPRQPSLEPYQEVARGKAVAQRVADDDFFLGLDERFEYQKPEYYDYPEEEEEEV